MTSLYYTPPSDQSFEDMKKSALMVWSQYEGSPGNYYQEKVARVRDIKNIGDNFLYMFAMFDSSNQAKVVKLLQLKTKRELRERLLDGMGVDQGTNYCEMIGLYETK